MTRNARFHQGYAESYYDNDYANTYAKAIFNSQNDPVSHDFQHQGFPSEEPPLRGGSSPGDFTSEVHQWHMGRTLGEFEREGEEIGPEHHREAEWRASQYVQQMEEDMRRGYYD